jgi:Domain of unknown function (DUF4386)
MSSPATYARVAGVLFLVSIVAGGFGEGFAPSQLIVSGDAAATAHNVVASDGLFRAGFASYILEGMCDAALTAILYVLLRPVDRSLALVAVVFRILATATFAFAELFYFVPSLLVANDAYLGSFTAAQRDALVLLALNVYGVGGTMSLAFYGAGSMFLGYLMYRSTYVPRILGALWALGGLCFVARTFTFVLVPAYSPALLQVPMVLAILLLAVWWLIRGVDAVKWSAKAGGAA